MMPTPHPLLPPPSGRANHAIACTEPVAPPEPTEPDADLLASAVDVLGDAVLVLAVDGTVRWGNHAAEVLFGIDRAHGLGLNALTLIHPDDVVFATTAIESVRQKEFGTPIELRVMAHDGWRLVEVVGAPLRDGLAISLRDLTERRRWEVAHGEDERFRALVQNASMLTMLVAGDGTVMTSSAALSRLLGHDTARLEGRPFTEIVAPQSRAALDEVIAAAGGDGPFGRSVTLDVDLVAASGAVVPYAITIDDLLADPTVGALVVSGHDITDRTEAVTALRAANSVLAATLESTADGIVVVGADGHMVRANERFLGMVGLDGTSVGDDNALVAAARRFVDPDEFLRSIQRVGSTGDRSLDTVELVDGRVLERDSLPQRIDGDVVGRVWNFRDVTEPRRLQAELTRRAFHDSLTGLANQSLFRNRVEHALTRAARARTTVAVLFIDLDGFKNVNDGLGHAVGDQMLVAVGKQIVASVRTGDTVARLGGDEFAVLIEEIDDPTVAVAIAERILAAIRCPVDLARRSVTVAASVGIAFGGSNHGVGADTLLRHADLAMYTAKSKGKCCVRTFEPWMHRAAVEHVEIESALRGAAARGELVVRYQPVFELASGRIHSAEALVRWQHPERGLLGPDAFIAIAEQSDLIDEIGEFVLAEALQTAVHWSAEFGERAPDISVNLSPHQLLDSASAHRIIDAVEASGIVPERLMLEITEGALMTDPVAVGAQLRALRDAGIRLAVDDFGTGYSSLAYLQQFPIDILKVDQTFVSAMDDRADRGLVPGIVQLARHLGLIPVAEGVSTPAQVDALVRLGCDFGQGFLLAEPMPAEAVSDLLTASDPCALPGSP